ncbi:hypothetical protein E1262_23870 [Jiangella aurantiaca]|uniref:Uncharacterized protein n=1 Tax=Jiangella aurantiaca TaxID=2530373 RepID=A0A4R5A4L2_9ACTN|nr:hypothetical protein [Jiangella aurantiaca]TDD65856.1 hypothetical protein E1262_23870 [Jiangella aurantiaca]
MLGRSPRTVLLATAAALPALRTQGNRVVDANGAPVTLRGVSMPAPEQNDVCTDRNSKPISELIDQVRLVIADPSNNAADIARV